MCSMGNRLHAILTFIIRKHINTAVVSFTNILSNYYVQFVGPILYIIHVSF